MPFLLKVYKMTEAKVKTKKTTKHLAKKTLFTSSGKVLKGEEFTCTDKELEAIKANKGV
jgi:hypothetical protein